MSAEQWIIGALERAGKTAGQVFASVMIAAGAALSWTSVWHAVDIALLAGVVALITSIVSIHISQALPPYLQVILRAGLTFGQTALAYLAANTFVDLTSVPWIVVFQTAAVATLTSVLTSWASYNVGVKKEHPTVVAV